MCHTYHNRGQINKVKEGQIYKVKEGRLKKG
jgi:hypothetical protein